MANQDHVDIVREGTVALADWRSRHPGERLDLTKADLSEINLSGADLSYAEITFADFSYTDLAGANLSHVSSHTLPTHDGTRFLSANLKDADLQVAELSSVDFREADLSRANLRGSKTEGCDFSWANLTNTEFGNVDLSWAIFNGCDLSSCIGLDTVECSGESASIDVETLRLTMVGLGGTFTMAHQRFFAELEVPQILLDYLPGLFTSNPLQFYKCFVSYASLDEPFPTKLYQDLTKASVSCWKFDESAVLGRGVWANIDRAIRHYDKLIVVCSERSLVNPAVLNEIERGLQKEDELKRRKPNSNTDVDVVFPIRIDNFVFEGWQHERRADLVSRVIGDFRDWSSDSSKYDREFRRLLDGLTPKAWLRDTGRL